MLLHEVSLARQYHAALNDAYLKNQSVNSIYNAFNASMPFDIL